MAHAEFSGKFEVESDKLLSVITGYRDYPEFVESCSGVTILDETEGKARVEYRVSLMKDISYVLDHVAKGNRVEWRLVKSDFLKQNSGYWELRPGSGSTEVFYSIDIDFSFPVPGFILSKLIKGTLPKMVRSFVQRAGGRT